MSQWQTKSSKTVYENPWISVREDEVIMPNGQAGLYGVVSSKSDAVFVIPVDEMGNTYIVQQEHYTTRELEWQVVAGRTDGESPTVAAKRELLEEAGIQANKITVLLDGRSATGITTFRSTICIAQGLSFDDSQFDASEISSVKKLPLQSAIDMVHTGEIVATESIAALFLAHEYLQKNQKTGLQ